MTSEQLLFFDGEQPYVIRVIPGKEGREHVLVQCIRCERATLAPHALIRGEEGPSLDPGVGGASSLICGHPDCRAAFSVWRGRAYAHSH